MRGIWLSIGALLLCVQIFCWWRIYRTGEMIRAAGGVTMIQMNVIASDGAIFHRGETYVHKRGRAAPNASIIDNPSAWERLDPVYEWRKLTSWFLIAPAIFFFFLYIRSRTYSKRAALPPHSDLPNGTA